MSTIEEPLNAWIGSTEVREDTIHLSQALGVEAMLDRNGPLPGNGDPLPPLWHWFYFLPQVAASRISTDGHPQRGGFMPPVDLPRRMFAGARTKFLQPLIIGEAASRAGEVISVVEKSGKSGRLVFVTVRYRIQQHETLCIEEEQDIVYKEPGGAVPAPVALENMPELPEDCWRKTVHPNEILLFRFSALTFNAHRIHYDRAYAMNQEGYPGLVVHGPLTALLLAEWTAERSGKALQSFAFQGRAPLFDFHPFRLVATSNENSVDLQAQSVSGKTTMSASARLAD